MRKPVVSLLSLLTALVLAVGLLPVSASAAAFSDVSAGDWYAEAVSYVSEHGLMSGVGQGKFSPDTILTRAQIVTLFYRMAGSPASGGTVQFQDISPERHGWAMDAIAWASENGLVKGTSATTFSPVSPITREQLAALIERYVSMTGTALPEAQDPVIGFKDSWRIASYAEDGVLLVWRAGIMNGDSLHNFGPKSPVGRGEAADVFMRLDRALKGESLAVSVRDVTPDHAALSADEKNAMALVVAQQLADAIPKDMTDLERVSLAASVVSYYCEFCDYTMEGRDYRTPYGVFIKGEFSCAGATRALGMVLTCMGYEWTHVNENQYGHQWCELTMDGQVGYADGQIGYAGYGPHFAAE